MAENTSIEWSHHTWSPWIGCQKVSPACDHCYAEALMDKRLGRVEWGPSGERKLTSNAYWRAPLRWERAAAASGQPMRVFPSLCDPFDNKAPACARERFAELIGRTPNLTWLLLTKRIGNAGAMLAEMFPEGTPANVWLGATVVTQEEADRDIPKLLMTPVAKRFLSMEPLLGPVDLSQVHYFDDDGDELIHCPLTGRGVMYDLGYYHPGQGTPEELTLGWAPTLDWIIVGGESGHGARPMDPAWARSLRDQCAAARVPFLFKQWGETAPVHAIGWDHLPEDRDLMFKVGKRAAGRLLDGVTHNGFPEVHHG